MSKTMDTLKQRVTDLAGKGHAMERRVHDGIQFEVRFRNGFGLSVIRHSGGYCSMRNGAPLDTPEPDFECQIIEEMGGRWPMVTAQSWVWCDEADDMVEAVYLEGSVKALAASLGGGGWQSAEEVLAWMEKVAALPRSGR